MSEKVQLPVATRVFYIDKIVISLSWGAYVPNNPNILQFNIYRATTRSDNFELIHSTALNQYLDITAVSNLWYEYIYKITFLTEEGESSLNDATTFALMTHVATGFKGISEYVLNEQIRRIFMFVGEHTGEEVLLLLRKKVGGICPCFDVQTGMVKNARCTSCFGTGVIGGYETIESRIWISDGTEVIKETPTGLELDYDVSSIIPAYPVLESSDYVVRQDGKILGIVDNKYHRFQNHLVEQSVKLKEIRPDDIIYYFLI